MSKDEFAPPPGHRRLPVAAYRKVGGLYLMRIELRGVVKAYRSLRALDHVSLEIEPGQIVGALGANGAGKTTLLRCLAGIAAPDTGTESPA